MNPADTGGQCGSIDEKSGRDVVSGIENDVVTAKEAGRIGRSEHVGESFDPGPSADPFKRPQCRSGLGDRLLSVSILKQDLSVKVCFTDTVTVEDGQKTDPAAYQRLCKGSADSSTTDQ